MLPLFYLELWNIEQHLLCKCFRSSSLKIDHLGFILVDVMDDHHSASTEQWTLSPSCRSHREPISHQSHTYPPIPDTWGCTTPRQSAAATAASTLDPRSFRTFWPSAVQRTSSDTSSPLTWWGWNHCEEKWCWIKHILKSLTYLPFPQINMQDQSNSHSKGKGDTYSGERSMPVLPGATLICLFEGGQAFIRKFHTGLFWESSEVWSCRKTYTVVKPWFAVHLSICWTFSAKIMLFTVPASSHRGFYSRHRLRHHLRSR